MNILFVCTGNTCRSPMAAALFARAFPAHEADCAGLAVFAPSPASANAVSVMGELDIDLTAHRSKPVTPELCEAADLIFCMTQTHRQALLSAGIPAEKIKTLDVSDPFGGDLDTYRQCRDELTVKIKGLTDV